MQLLVLGGTRFLGRAIVAEARRRGHKVSILTRGLQIVASSNDVEHFRGDRGEILQMLRNRQWDAVIDTSGYTPATVRVATQLLADATQHYTFVSTLSVYAQFHALNSDEDSAIVNVTGVEGKTVSDEMDDAYGVQKVLCEREVMQWLPEKALIIRPGLIVGPYDYLGYFTYWCERIGGGGEILAPEPRSQHVQFIDARDLAIWMLNMAERRQIGVYNAVGPDVPLSLGDFLDACLQVAQSSADLIWADERFLYTVGVRPWEDLPLWIGPSNIPGERGAMSFNGERARAFGLRCRPITETIDATLTWIREVPAPINLTVGLHKMQEQAILAIWRQYQAGNISIHQIQEQLWRYSDPGKA